MENSKRVFEEEVSPDMQSFISEYKSRLQAAGWNLNNLSDAQRIAIGLDISSFLDQFKEMLVDTRNFNGAILESNSISRLMLNIRKLFRACQTCRKVQ